MVPEYLPTPGRHHMPYTNHHSTSTLWEHNIAKVPELQKQSPFQLGEWTVTYRKTNRDDTNYRYGKVGPLASDTDLEEVRDSFRTLDGGQVVEISWIPDRSLPRNTRGKWL